MNTANKYPTGLTIDPSGASQSIWIVDSVTDKVYEYGNARGNAGGSLVGSFALAPGNTNPQGIADPPPASPNANVANNQAVVSNAVASIGVGPVPMPWFGTSASNGHSPALPRMDAKARSTDNIMSTFGRSMQVPQATAAIGWTSPAKSRESVDLSESHDLELAEDNIEKLIGLVATNLWN